MLYLTLRFVHILFMTTWFAASLWMAGDVRRTLKAGPGGVDLLSQRVKRMNIVGIVGGLGTVGTGVALIFTVGGFGAVSPAIHTALLLSLLMLVLGALMGRVYGAMAADPANASKKFGQLSAFSGIFQLLWLVCLALMVFRNAG